MASPFLNVHNLSIAFPPYTKAVIDNLSFDLSLGGSLAVVGESGSGKSLSAKAILQCCPSNARIHENSYIQCGDIALLSLSEGEMQSLRGGMIGYINQEAQSAFNPVRTIGQQIDETLRIHTQLDKKARLERIKSLLIEVGLPDPNRVIRAYPHELSGGMRQRALIASVIAPEPSLLIADEPTTALDVTLQAQLINLLNTLRKNRQMSLLFITHNLLLVPNVADDILIMKDGKMIAHQTVSSFFSGPKDTYSQQLLSAATPKRLVRPMANTAPLYEANAWQVPCPQRGWLAAFKKPPKPIVQPIAWRIEQGKTLAIVGESGAGKTSLMRALMGLMPWKGNLFWQNTPSDPGIYPKRQQVLFQDPLAALNPYLTLAASLNEACQHAGYPQENWHAHQQQMLEAVNLSSDMLTRYPHMLSGGQRQRLCLARALLCAPKLLCLDEPTSALDVTIQAQILALLKQIQSKNQCSYLLITHDWAVVEALAHDVLVLKDGEIVEAGTTEQIMHAPAHTYTQTLLHAVPTLS